VPRGQAIRPRFLLGRRFRRALPIPLRVRGRGLGLGVGFYFGFGWWYPYIPYYWWYDRYYDRYDTADYYGSQCQPDAYACTDDIHCCSGYCLQGYCEPFYRDNYQEDPAEPPSSSTGTVTNVDVDVSYVPPEETPFDPSYYYDAKSNRTELPPAGQAIDPDESELIEVDEDPEGEVYFANGTYYYEVANVTYYWVPDPEEGVSEEWDDGYWVKEGREDVKIPQVPESSGGKLRELLLNRTGPSSLSYGRNASQPYIHGTGSVLGGEVVAASSSLAPYEAMGELPNGGDDQLTSALSATLLKLLDSGEWFDIWSKYFDGDPQIPMPLDAAIYWRHGGAVGDGRMLQEGSDEVCRETSLPPMEDAHGTLKRVLSSGELWVGSDFGYPPFAWRSANGSVWGFEVDVINALADYLSDFYDISVRPIFVYRPVHRDFFVDLIAPLYDDHYDVVSATVFPTPVRAEMVSFPCPYMAGDRSALIAGPNATKVLNSSSLELEALNTAKMKIGHTPGTSRDEIIEEHLPNATIVDLFSLEAMLDALSTGRTHAILYSYDVMAFVNKLHPHICDQCTIVEVFPDAAPIAFVTRHYPTPRWLADDAETETGAPPADAPEDASGK